MGTIRDLKYLFKVLEKQRHPYFLIIVISIELEQSESREGEEGIVVNQSGN